MSKDPYLVLGITPGASEQEIDEAYSRLKQKYSEDRFLSGEAGYEAATKLTELEDAYLEAKQKLEYSKSEQDYGSRLGAIENLIKQNKTNEAQNRLDEISERNAEWHYLQSIIFYKKSWYEESKFQLEMAAGMEPDNARYKDALNRLNVFMNGQGRPDGQNTNTNRQYRQADGQFQNNQDNRNFNNNRNNNYNNYEERNMGGCGSGGAENCCLQLLCADCCCECMGGDLVMCC